MIALLFSQPLLFLTWTIAFLVALSIHEFSHALVATWLGDTTAKRMGRLTLNPAAHVDPLGLIAVLMIGFGWGKPVPFNPYNLRWPKWGPTAVAAAGPISNLLLAFVSALLIFAFGTQLGPDNLLTVFLYVSLELNVALMVFNLIPLPPLDGSKALLSILAHPKYAAARTFIETKGPMLLILLILLDSFSGLGLFSGLFSFALSFVTRIIPILPLF
jgi:Zn-dependent protease